MTMEEINLASDEDITQFTDEQQISLQQLNFKFRQESKIKGVVREFTVFNDNQCYQKVTRKHGGKKKFRIDLNYLDPEPRRMASLSISWLITGAISAIVSFLLVYLGWFSTLVINRNLLMVATSVTLAFTLIAFLLAWLRSSDRVFMYSRHGRVAVLEFINKNPDPVEFTKFLAQLRQHIKYAQRMNPLSPAKQLTLELQELRRLSNEKVISNASYEQAKQRIFRHQAFNADSDE